MSKWDALAEATIENGGATFTKDGDTITEGYAVAVGGTHYLAPDEVSGDNIAYLVGVISDQVGKVDAFGTWVEEGTVYVEAVKVYASKEVAEAVADVLHEIAYFDLNTKTEIRL